MRSLDYRIVFALALAAGAGFAGISPVFSDLGPGETWQWRFAIIVVYNLLCGVALGFFFPKHWLLAPLCAWGSVIFGLLYAQAALIELQTGPHPEADPNDPPAYAFALFVLLAPALCCFVGGFVGKLVGPRVFRALRPTAQ